MSKTELYGTITSKTESFARPSYPMPGESTEPKLQTAMHIEIIGYGHGNGVTGGSKIGTAYLTLDGTDALAQLNAGTKVSLSVETR